MTVHTASNLTALKSALDLARPGDTVRPQGTFGAFRWGRKTYADPLTLDLSDAVVSVWNLGAVDGLVIRGGVLSGNNALRMDSCRNVRVEGVRVEAGPEGYGIWFNRGQFVSVEGCAFSDLLFGLRFDQVDDVSVVENLFRGLRSDGARFAECHRWKFSRNALLGFKPVDGAHPDGCQGWSRATSLPSCDIEITDNLIVGWAQGVFLGNHVRSYAAGTKLADGRVLTLAETLNDGGFDRVTIARNRIIGGYSQAICVGDGRDVTVTANHVSTYEGADNQAMINLLRCEGLVRSGNTIDAGDGRKAIVDPT